MTDKTDSKEREAFEAHMRKLNACTRLERQSEAVGGNYRTISVQRAWELWQAGRASLAASAGSEPVAWVDERALSWLANSRSLSATITTKLEKGKSSERPMPLYTPTTPTEGMVGGWIALPGALPEPGVPVLLDIGKKYPIRAMWAAKHTVEAADDDTDWGEYDEATETYYCPEGWYEWNEHEDTNWAVSATPRAWAPLPLPAPPASEAKGA